MCSDSSDFGRKRPDDPVRRCQQSGHRLQAIGMRPAERTAATVMQRRGLDRLAALVNEDGGRAAIGADHHRGDAGRQRPGQRACRSGQDQGKRQHDAKRDIELQAGHVCGLDLRRRRRLDRGQHCGKFMLHQQNIYAAYAK
ncbi:MAG: hypothetical protein M5U35_11475 [Roseovarius sp.]|nr:hypothetical protein [Roseovarius sp.]